MGGTSQRRVVRSQKLLDFETEIKTKLHKHVNKLGRNEFIIQLNDSLSNASKILSAAAEHKKEIVSAQGKKIKLSKAILLQVVNNFDQTLARLNQLLTKKWKDTRTTSQKLIDVSIQIDNSLKELIIFDSDSKLRITMDVAGGIGRLWLSSSLAAIKAKESTEERSYLMYSYALARLAQIAQISQFFNASTCYALEADFMLKLSENKVKNDAQPNCRLNAFPPGSQAKVKIMITRYSSLTFNNQ